MRLQVGGAVAALLGVVAVLVLTAPLLGCASEPSQETVQADPADEDGSGKLEPRYQPREPLEKPWYNSDYLFGMTRAVTGSTIHTGAQIPLLVLTVPFDILFLPFAAIGGLFG